MVRRCKFSCAAEKQAWVRQSEFSSSFRETNNLELNIKGVYFPARKRLSQLSYIHILCRQRKASGDSLKMNNTERFENTSQELQNIAAQKYSRVWPCKPDFQFGFQTVALGTLSVFGIILNSLIIIVVRKDKGNKVANFLLQALSVADNLLLVVFLSGPPPLYALRYFKQKDAFNVFLLYLKVYGKPLSGISTTMCVWMTVLIAVNRYIVIKKPLHASNLCTLGKVKTQIASVVIFSIVWNLPRFLIGELVTDENGNVKYQPTSYFGP